MDCAWGKKNREVSDKYGVRGYPTTVFTDPEGKEVGRMKARDAASVAKQIEDLAAKYPGENK